MGREEAKERRPSGQGRPRLRGGPDEERRQRLQRRHRSAQLGHHLPVPLGLHRRLRSLQKVEESLVRKNHLNQK